MFVSFFQELKQAGVPVTLREYLTLLEAMDADLASRRVDDFYYLSRAALVKDERNIDKFDRVFGHVFKGLETIDGAIEADIPAEWLKKLAEKYLTEEEKKQIEAMGGLDKLLETLRKRLAEQKGRHQGGSKWIGTAGTSPYGAYGYNPEGIRIGQDANRNFRAVKVWDKREFKDLDDEVELGTRNIKLALRRLRKFARTGAPAELDLDGTIKGTAHKGYLDILMRPERHNAAKVLLFFDIGVQMILTGGSKLNPEVALRLRPELGCEVQQVLGMAEGPLYWTRLDDPDDIRLHTQGRPQSPGDEFRIVDPVTNQDVAPGERGELWCRGPHTIRGYYRAEEYNANAFSPDGFYKSGDLVRLHPSGNVVVEGRNKDCINRGGEKISAEEVENHIIAHPAVLNCGVVAMPDPLMGEKSCAYVVLMPESSLTLDGLCEFLTTERKIARFKLPERLEIVETLALTNVGKINKKALREDVAAKIALQGQGATLHAPPDPFPRSSSRHS